MSSTKQSIKPIETTYKGYRFRSRLEARWATFFDSLGIQWVYEPEGYFLPSGKYLPDFWLPQTKLWAEVKPTEFTDTEKRLLLQVIRMGGYGQSDCRGGLLLVGPPEVKTYRVVSLEIAIDEVLLTNHHNYPQEEGRFYSSPSDYELVFGSGIADDTHAAVEAARSARFEHGESGAR